MTIDSLALARLREGWLFATDGPAVADEIERLRAQLAALAADAALGAAVRAAIPRMPDETQSVWCRRLSVSMWDADRLTTSDLYAAIADTLDKEGTCPRPT
jgi:hypothetical protein